MKACERRELDNRANKGTINKLLEELRAIRECDAHCEYCPGVDKPHGPKGAWSI
jgi:hypothetical protein